MEGLSIICAGLGSIEEYDDNRIGYELGEYCLDNLKDLLRFLRRDDPVTREVFKQVCKWNIVGKHLIPIIEHFQDNRNLVLNAVKVLVFLTMPVEPTSKDIPQQIEYLWQLKSSITCSDTVAVIVSLLESPLENLESEAFTEDDWKLVQLVLTLFRNILAIQDISLQQKLGGSASEFLSLRDRFMELLFNENVMDLILVLTQHIGGSCGYFRQDNLLLLEVFHYIFMGQDPELIAKAHMKGSKVDGDAEASLNSLRSIMEEEAEKRKLARLRNLSCYTQYTGTFTKLTMDGSKTLLKGNPCSGSHDTLLNTQKIHRGPSQRMVWDQGQLPSTKDSILESLHDFLNQFLSGGYNVLMQSVREDIEKEHHSIQSSDIVIFFQVARFVTSFQYQKLLILKPNFEANTYEDSVNHHADSTLFEGSICGPIAESMNESMFLLVISKWRNAFDGLKETNDYKFLSAAGSLTKIMIRMLDLVLKQSPEDSKEHQTARILLYKLFYDQTDQGMTQFLLNLFKSFDRHKQAKSDLADLLETIHVVVRLMENLQARGTLRVSKKSRKKIMKKTSNDKKDSVNETVGLSGGEQSIDMNTTDKDTSRNPNSEGNGEEDITIPLQVDEPEISKLKEMENKKSDIANDDYETEDSSGEEQLTVTNEVDLKVSTVVSALANATIIQNLCWLLKFYKSNSTSTNHYIICMLRRICDDLELSPMLYQLSFLTTFHDILGEQKSSPCKEYENIVVFLSTLIRRMLRKMKSYPLLFVEILFWKTRKECHYINCESMLNDLGNLKRKWGRASVDGEFRPSEGKEWMPRSIADALGDDEADFVIPHGIDDHNEDKLYDASGQNVSKRRKGSFENGNESITLISNEGINGKENSDNEGLSERVHKRKKRLVLSDELEKKVKDLYEKYKENPKCTHLIAEDMEGKVSPAQVSKKLKQLGFAIPPKRKVNKTGGSSHPSEENPSLRQLSNTRKRVRAFSEDQELMIRTLFEQFKDHRRCSYMIANSLDADGTFTAAQVSRKLKQLGLCVPRQKRSNADLHLRDEEETLSSLKQRSKRKQITSESEERPNQNDGPKMSENDADDELLCSFLESKRKQITSESEERPYQNDGGKLSQDDADDELLISVLRNRHEQATNTRAAEDRDINDRDAESEEADFSSGPREIVAFAGKADNSHQRHDELAHELADELADFGDDETPLESSPQKANASRRKLRMVLDLDDDE